MSSRSVAEKINPGDTVVLWFRHSVDKVVSIDIPDDTSGGSWSLVVDGEKARPVGFDSSASELTDVVERLPNVGRDGVIAWGGPLPSAPISIQFVGPGVAKRDVTVAAESDITPAAPVSIVETQAGGLVSPDAVSFKVKPPRAADVSITATELGAGVFRGEYTIPGDGPVGVYAFTVSAEGVAQSTRFTVEAL